MPTPDHIAKDELSDKQRLFVAEYLRNGGNGAAAAAEAGYGAVGAKVTASRLLRNPAVAERIKAGRERQNGRVEGVVGMDVFSAERILIEAAYIAYSDPVQVLNDDGTPKALKDVPEPTRRAISKIKVRVDAEGARIVEFGFWDKPAGLKMLGNRLGLFTEKVQVTGEGGEPLTVQVLTYREGEGK